MFKRIQAVKNDNLKNALIWKSNAKYKEGYEK